MKKIILLLAIMCFCVGSVYGETAILREDSSLYLPEIKYRGENTGFEAVLEYQPESSTWKLTELKKNKEIPEILDRINNIREEAGREPLEWNNELSRAAENHSEDMKENGYFSHTGLDGSSFVDRVYETNYKGRPLGENIALGRDPVTQWKNSEGHYQNIINSRAKDFGFGSAGNYHTMLIGY